MFLRHGTILAAANIVGCRGHLAEECLEVVLSLGETFLSNRFLIVDFVSLAMENFRLNLFFSTGKLVGRSVELQARHH